MAARVLGSGLNPAACGPDKSGLFGPSMVKVSTVVSYPMKTGRALGVVAFATTPGKPRGIMKPRPITPEFQEFVGAPEISRTQALKVIWAHIKANNLQDPQNKKIILCDEKLKKIFAGKERVGFLEISGLISPHLL